MITSDTHTLHAMHATPTPQGPLAKVVAFLLSIALLVVGFMFSLVALAVIAVIGVALGGWFWWKTRTLRRQIREAQASADSGPATAKQDTGGSVIEGEFVREPAARPSQWIGRSEPPAAP